MFLSVSSFGEDLVFNPTLLVLGLKGRGRGCQHPRVLLPNLPHCPSLLPAPNLRVQEKMTDGQMG